ncbi:FK506-binding protein 2 [Pseudocercospora fuligena]|uniref:peptidylprolyl isomerase n=1 Tax=Pseudocercospora fuligena TaxID=685502 RepID=A0A8H6RLW4_9PEZI|nr:FK506-binding protein 2 [Pseudocercospora fuligena]
MRSLSASVWRTALLLSTTTLAAAETETRPDGLIIETTSGPVTCDRPTRAHDTISVHYKGTLQSDGSEFDESYKRGKPFEFKLGDGQVIQGWDEGLLGMCIGQSRKLTIPPELGYGDYGAGPIPPKATLVFETKLMDIVNMSKDEKASATEESISIATAPSTPPESDEELKEEGILPPDDDQPGGPEKQAKCHLLGPFALLVQGALGLLAVLTLVYKRWREVPKRPWKIFFFDVSKQLFGSMLTHVINLAMSMLGSADIANAAANVAGKDSQTPHGRMPNPCSFYLLNLAIDTTIGVPVLYVLLNILHALFKRTPLANPPESIKSGHYDQPPRVTWYLKQLLIYCIGLTFMKLFVLVLFEMLPWLPWVGDWALRWTEGNEALQITFAMFIFPLAMNAVQYWIIDSFIMDKKKGSGGQKYSPVGGDDDGEDERRAIMDDDDTEHGSEGRKSAEVVESEDTGPLKEVNPTPIPVYSQRRGEGSSGGSSPRERDMNRKTS